MKLKINSLGWSTPQIVFIALTLLAGAISFSFSLRGWNASIGGPQDFRQSQTAIATYYIAKEGPMLATKIPVLGPRWHIAYELPTYQTLVAGIHRFTGWPVDQTGRGVSLLFFYLSIWLLVRLLRRLKFPFEAICLTVAFVLASPLYIFWSRGFLIESLALFLALGFAILVLQATEKRTLVAASLACIVGVLAALTKFTTFSIAFGFVILWTAALFVILSPNRKEELRKLPIIGLCLAVPLGFALLWSQYLAYIWAQSPLTEGQADAIHAWNFGTMALRQSPPFWERFYLHGIKLPTASYVPWLLGFVAFTFSTFRWRVTALCLFSAWISGPLVWANLFFVHDYYFYATTIFGIAWMTASVVGVTERWPFLKYPLLSGGFVGVGILFAMYPRTDHFVSQKHDWGYETQAFAQEVGSRIEKDEIIFIIGADWNPLISYYSQRYSIMIRWEGFTKGDDFRRALDLLREEGRPVAGLAIVGGVRWIDDQAWLQETFRISDTASITSVYGNLAFYPSELRQLSTEKP